MLDLGQYSVGGGLLLSKEFWIAYIAFVLIAGPVYRITPSLRHWVFVVANVGFLFFFTEIGIWHLAGLLVALVILYVAVNHMLSDSHKGKTIFLFSLGITVLIWGVGKIAIGIKPNENPLSWLYFVGISFLVIKVWSLLKDVWDGRVKYLTLGSFLNYFTFFPCFISGPMHYYGEFYSTFERPLQLRATDTVHNLYRLLYGILKVRVLAVAIRPYSLAMLQDAHWSDISFERLLGGAIVYSAVLYLDFSGYCDIAIGTSRLLGISVPENFRLPYLATNIRDFWQCWHITFTRFLTQYVFIPFVRAGQTSLSKIGSPTLAVLGYVITFTFVGFWHGSEVNFILWGLWHGIGMSLYDMYKRTSTKLIWNTGYTSGPWSLVRKTVAMSATFSFVSASWIFFVLPVKFFV